MQINSAEQKALQHSISNDARVLYLLGLKPIANQQTGITDALNYKSLLTLLNGKEPKFTLGREVNGLVKELLQVGLVSVKHQIEITQSFNGKTLTLPLMVNAPDNYRALHINWHPMTLDWTPNPSLIKDLAQLIGIIDADYTASELGDFIAYWLGRPEAGFTEYQWTQKFVFNLKKTRLAHGLKPVKKIGQQIVTSQAGIEADQNTKNLVAKYGKTGSN
jgi:hypothetical protein